MKHSHNDLSAVLERGVDHIFPIFDKRQEGLPPAMRMGGYVVVPGPGGRGNVDRPLSRECRWALSRGQLVIMVSPRGAAGHGTAWLTDGSYEAAAEDVSEVVKALQRQGILDPEQTQIGGRSHGARIAALAVARSPEAFSETTIYEHVPTPDPLPGESSVQQRGPGIKSGPVSNRMTGRGRGHRRRIGPYRSARRLS